MAIHDDNSPAAEPEPDMPYSASASRSGESLYIEQLLDNLTYAVNAIQVQLSQAHTYIARLRDRVDS